MTSAMLNKVLIVDDDPAIVRILTAHLEAAGYEVSSASNGSQAWELVQREQPAYLITDWEMPEMDGLELCRRVRQLEFSRYVYVIFLTACSRERDLVTAMEAGADDFLNKPLRKPELLARLSAGSRILRLESRLHELAAHDTLTGLLIRRPFGEFAEKEWQRSLRHRLSLSAVMVDIDFFKQVNDTHGHQVGDEVIRRVASLMCECARTGDVVCRYGGEEFCMLLPETDESSAVVCAERLRRRIAGMSIPIGTTSLQVTVSLGVAGMLADMEDKDELLALADRCLLAAKEQGRNRVISLQSLTESGCLAGDDGTDPLGFDGVVARDAMIPLFHCLRADWPIVRAAAYLLQYRVSSAPVIDKNGQLLGIVSEKDVLAIARSPQAANRCADDVMRSNVITYEDNAPLARILDFLARTSIRSVVITSSGEPCGLISRAVLVRWLLENRWNVAQSEDSRSRGDASGNSPADGESSLLKMASQLVTEAEQLHRDLQSSHPDDDTPIVGGASRMQQLIDELLAGLTGGCRVGGGLPF